MIVSQEWLPGSLWTQIDASFYCKADKFWNTFLTHCSKRYTVNHISSSILIFYKLVTMMQIQDIKTNSHVIIMHTEIEYKPSTNLKLRKIFKNRCHKLYVIYMYLMVTSIGWLYSFFCSFSALNFIENWFKSIENSDLLPNGVTFDTEYMTLDDSNMFSSCTCDLRGVLHRLDASLTFFSVTYFMVSVKHLAMSSFGWQREKRFLM